MRLFFLDLGDEQQKKVGNLEMSLVHSGLARLLLTFKDLKQENDDVMALGLAGIELGREAGDFQAEVMVCLIFFIKGNSYGLCLFAFWKIYHC
jgi:hypothetical protein